jgi:hypothetical protein
MEIKTMALRKDILEKYKIKMDVTRHRRHPKCKGYTIYSMDGNEYDCEYGSKLDCDQCKYGGGRKDPEAKCNDL